MANWASLMLPYGIGACPRKLCQRCTAGSRALREPTHGFFTYGEMEAQVEDESPKVTLLVTTGSAASGCLQVPCDIETQQSPLDPEVGMARDEWRSHSHMSQVSSAVDGRQFSFHLCSRFSCGLDNRSPELYLSLQR